MKFRLIEKQIESISITAPRKSPAVDVTGGGGCGGGDSIAFVMTASAASTPGTATIQLEGSLDDTDYFAIGSTTSISANGVFALKEDRPAYKFYRVSYAIASGSYTSTLKVLVKGDRD